MAELIDREALRPLCRTISRDGEVVPDAILWEDIAAVPTVSCEECMYVASLDASHARDWPRCHMCYCGSKYERRPDEP